MIRASLILIYLSIHMIASGQDLQAVINKYETYKERSIKDRRFKHPTVDSLVNSLKELPEFEVKKEGESIEGRAIYSVTWGSGPVNILMWSQMHGDESTATMAIMDIFNFLKSEDYPEFKAELASKVTLTFLPMLNPDGAERFRRRNALGVDLNRDALRLQSPESNILKNKRDELDADFGFNLHDQGRVYSVGLNPKQATISFLAPAFNYEKDMNEVRENSMKLISVLTKTLHEYIPGHIAKYSDDFEPRAFGDNIQKWGTSLILIESGGFPGDRDKQEIRRMNFIALMTSFKVIAEGSYKAESIQEYQELPFNERLFFDLLIKGVTIEKDGKEYLVDIAINHNEVDTNGHRNYYLNGVISEVGDLSIYYGYEELDGRGFKAVPGSVEEGKGTALDILRRGGLFVKESSSGEPKLNILHREKAPVMNFEIGNRANFMLMKDGKFRYAILNGFLIDLAGNSISGYGVDLR